MTEKVSMTHNRKVDATGRRQLRRKASIEEQGRRDALMVRLTKMGHSQREIAEALDFSPSGVSDVLRRLGVPQRHGPGRGPVTDPCPWRDEDMPPAPAEEEIARWHRSAVVDMIEMLDVHLSEGSFANVLANQVNDAIQAGDRTWVRSTTALVNEAIEKLGRAHRVLTDPLYRRECMDTHEGDERLRPRRNNLRSIR